MPRTSDVDLVDQLLDAARVFLALLPVEGAGCKAHVHRRNGEIVPWSVICIAGPNYHCISGIWHRGNVKEEA